MNIDQLAELVKELLMERSDVTLGGVGTFYSEDVPATFSNKGYTINPPYRKVSFRQRETGGNELAEYYSSTCYIDLPTAERVLSEFLSGMVEVLKEKKMIIFPGMGLLRATKENHFFFVPDEDTDVNPDNFTLESISLKFHSNASPICAATPPEVPVPAVTTGDGDRTAQSKDGIKPSPSKEPVTNDISAAACDKSGPQAGSAAKKPRRLLRAIVIIVIIAIVLSATLAIMGRTCPEIIDHILYSVEDYGILHS